MNCARPLLFCAVVLLPALLLAARPAGSDEPKPEIAPPAAEANDEGTFKPPPGFRPRKRGQLVVYCRREVPKGTRLPSEVCHDEAGIREMLQLQREEQQKVEQIRRMQTITIH